MLTAAPPPRVPTWRRVVMLGLLLAWLLLPAILPRIMGLSSADTASATALPPDTRGMLAVVGESIGVSAVLFSLAWLAGRPTREELWMARKEKPVTLAWGLGWSVVLRVAVVGLILLSLAPYALRHGLDDAGALVEENRPQLEHLLPFAALHDPVYVLILLTLVSFVLAGLREELWRAGMLTALLSLFPPAWRGRPGQAIAIAITSVCFGAAHFTQGPSGMVIAGVLGAGLGAIMVGHRSFWIAVWAHGFFDATTFAILWVLVRFNLQDVLLHHAK